MKLGKDDALDKTVLQVFFGYKIKQNTIEWISSPGESKWFGKSSQYGQLGFQHGHLVRHLEIEE